jgi:hypothetical protein
MYTWVDKINTKQKKTSQYKNIILVFKYFNTLQMSNSHSKSENVKLFGQNLQLISSLQKLPPVKVKKIFLFFKKLLPTRFDLHSMI